MAIARVNQGTDGLGVAGLATSGTTVSATLSQEAVAGNTLVAYFCCNTSSLYIKAVSGGGVTWKQLVYTDGSGCMVGIWYGENSTGTGTTITGTVNSNIVSVGMRILVTEFSGVSISTPEDIKDATNVGSSTSPVTDTVNPVDNIEEVFLAAHKGGTVSAGPTNSFISLNDPTTSGRFAYRIVADTSTDTFSTGWTQSTGAWATGIASLKGAVASTSSVVIPTLLTLNVG